MKNKFYVGDKIILHDSCGIERFYLISLNHKNEYCLISQKTVNEVKKNV